MLRLHPGKSSYKEKSSVPGSSLLPGCCHPSTRPQPLFQDPFSRSEEHGIIAGEEMDRGQFRGEGGNRERKNSWKLRQQRWQIIAAPSHCPLGTVL